MGGVSRNAESFAGEARGVEVLDGGERGTDDPLCCFHGALEGPSTGGGAGAVPFRGQCDFLCLCVTREHSVIIHFRTKQP